MANDINSAALSNSTLNSYYQSFLKELPMGTVEYRPIEMEAQTVESIGNQVQGYLRDYYDKAAAQRRTQTAQNNAMLDVDAASRGMSASTWLTDARNRQLQSQAADLSSLEGSYASDVAKNTYEQYANYLNSRLARDTQNVANQMEVDMFNAQARAVLEQLAYSRALEEYARTNRGSGGGGGGTDVDIDDPMTSDDSGVYWDAENQNTKLQAAALADAQKASAASAASQRYVPSYPSGKYPNNTRSATNPITSTKRTTR